MYDDEGDFLYFGALMEYDDDSYDDCFDNDYDRHDYDDTSQLRYFVIR